METRISYTCPPSAVVNLEALLSMFEYGFDLLPRDARKPVQEIVDARPVFQILEERLYRHPWLISG
jgi:hypothetical protein